MAKSRERLGAKVGEADGVPDKRLANAPKPAEVKPVEGVKPPEKPAAPVVPAKPVEIKPLEAAKPEATPAKLDPTLGPDGKPIAVDPKTGKLPGPWQLKEKWEKQARAYEAELLEVRSKLAKLGDTDAVTKRLEAAEARRTELEDEIRHVNYSKSEEFAVKYQKPLEEAWTAATTTFSQLKVFEADGTTQRQATPEDLTYLAQLPEGQLDDTAEALFGKSAPRALRHVEKVRELAAAQSKALSDARKAGAERATQQEAAMKLAKDESLRLWEETTSHDETSHDFLQSKEDDDEWNGRLEHAKEYVDTTFASQIADPKHTTAQRTALVKRWAKLRAGAIGFDMMKLQVKRLEAQVAARDAELATFKATQPGNGDGRADGSAAVQSSNPRARMMDRFNARMAV